MNVETVNLIESLIACGNNDCKGCLVGVQRYCVNILCQQAADKLEQLQKIIDDMLGDHYVDYLDWYANRCRELEEELENFRGDDNGDN